MSPEYFLRTYAYLQDRNRTKTVKFEPWRHLIELLELLLEKNPIIVLKARQIGVSYLLVGYCLWKARFFENAKVLFLSKKEDDAFDLISRCKFIDDNLPDFIKTTRDPNQRGLIGFPDTGSEIQALPSTDDAGRSTDATIVVCDEWEYHPYAELNYGALRPTISAGGQFIAMSTADKTKDTSKSFFKSMYIKAKSGDTGFVPKFYDVWSRPGRTKEWLENESKDMPPWMIEQEYPETEKEALETLRSRAFFDETMLDLMKADALSPMEHDLSAKYKGLVRIYLPPVVGRKYCVFADPSDGKDDPHAIVVLDVVSGDIVAESHGKTPADYCAQIFDDLARLYNAYNTYEMNARAGGIFSQKIKELNTPKQAPFTKPDGTLDNKKTGWWTGKKLRDTMVNGLEEAVRLRQIRLHSPESIEELKQFQRPEGEDPQAPRGGHDDYVMALGGAWQIKRSVPVGTLKVHSFQYRETV